MTTILTRQEIKDNLELWANDFVAWSESPFGYYVEQYWDEDRGQWTKTREYRPIVWHERQRQVLKWAYTRIDGMLPLSELWWIDIGKSGKTLIQAGVALWMGLFVDRFSEVFLAANSRDQAGGRTYKTLRNAIGWNPNLQPYVTVQEKEVTLHKNQNVIKPLPMKATTQAGGNQVFVGIDEIWGYEGESARDFIAEMKPAATRNISHMLNTTYMGFQGDDGPLNDVVDQFFDRDSQPREDVDQPMPDVPFFVRGRIGVYWNHEPYPWHHRVVNRRTGQTFLQEQYENAAVREAENHYLRIWEARRVEREDTFIPIQRWDACEDEEIQPLDWHSPKEHLIIGVDIGVKNDRSALVARSYEPGTQRIPLRYHKIWYPEDHDRDGSIIEAVKQTILDLHRRHNVIAVMYDPSQAYLMATQLEQERVRMVEVAQGKVRESADTAYLEMIIGTRLRNYVHQRRDLRQHVKHAVGYETRGGNIRIDKRKTTQFIDGAVADSMCCYGVTMFQSEIKRAVRRPQMIPALSNWKPMGQRIQEALSHGR